MAERDIAKKCRKRWDALGLLWRRVEWLGRHSAPDFVVMGRHPRYQFQQAEERLPTTVWVETKDDGEGPNGNQGREHKKMRAAGQVVLVIDNEHKLDLWFPLSQPRLDDYELSVRTVALIRNHYPEIQNDLRAVHARLEQNRPANFNSRSIREIKEVLGL